MKRLLLPLLAALALPTAVNAESYYLLVTFGGDRNFTVPMESLEQCEEQLAKVSNMKNWNRKYSQWVGGICIEGK